MIISNSHKFLYVAIPKTGTHAIREAIRPHLQKGDWEQCNLYETKILPFIELAVKKHGHFSTKEIKPFIGDEKFNDYTKFAFVRNPWDRFVSYCSFINRGSDRFQKNPQKVMEQTIFNPKQLTRLLLKPQHTFITNVQGEVNVDIVGRHETFTESFNEICNRIGIPQSLPKKVNTSKRSDYRDYYTPTLIDAVGAFYQKDIELFDYSFD